jgi:acetyl-CoA carboxylase biotin carboxylase subunit
MITGVDLVKEQIRLAAGEKLSFDSDDIKILGHAIECRINAEDPDRDFMPSPGKVTQFIAPGGPNVRVESHVYCGYTIPPFYDSMIAKVIAMDATRDMAIAKMQRALKEMVIEGVKTTKLLHIKIMDNEVFKSGDIATDFLPKHFYGPK